MQGRRRNALLTRFGGMPDTAAMERHEIRIAYIGGGSRGWAHMLFQDLALCPHLAGELALYDPDRAAAQRNVNVAEALFGHPDARSTFRTFAARTAAEALRGADFVVMSIEPGPVTIFNEWSPWPG